MPNNAIIPIGNLSGSITTGGLVPGLPIWTGEASGSIASFPDGSNNPILSLKFLINPIQEGNGTPSPQNERPLHGWTGANIYRTGKNLINAPDVTFVSSGGYIYNGAVNIPAGTYTMSLNWSGSGTPSATFAILDGDGNTLVSGGHNFPYTFTLTSTAKSARFYVSSVGTYTKIQIEAGTTATDYEPYNGTTYPITWSEAGEKYGGEIDVVNGSATETLNKIIMSEGSWVYDSRFSGFRRSLTNYKKISTSTIPNALCEIAPPLTLSNFINNTSLEGFTFGETGLYDNNILLRLTGITTVEQLASVISNKKLVYELATPNLYTLDEPIPTITMLLGNNNIWSNTGDITKVIYMRDWNIALNMLWEAVFG